MRVISGTARGLRLKSPHSDAVRPTTDRVRESLFSILAYRYRNGTVLDLFGGTGVLSIEALSRGARHATIIENAAPALALIRANLALAHFEDRATVVKGDAFQHLEKLAARNTTFDLIFADPPYASRFATRLATDPATARLVCNLLAAAAVIVIEHDRRERIELPTGASLAIADERTFGDTTLTFLERAAPPKPSTESGEQGMITAQ